MGDCIWECGESTPDSRYAISSLSLQLINDEVILLIGGGAGNCSMWTTAGLEKTFEPDLSTVFVDLLEDMTDRFIWEGHQAFKVNSNRLHLALPV